MDNAFEAVNKPRLQLTQPVLSTANNAILTTHKDAFAFT